MKREDINRNTLLLRAGVQGVVLLLLISQAGSNVIFWMTIMVTTLFLCSNYFLLFRPLPGRKGALVLLLIEWAAAVSLLPFVPYTPYFVLFIVLIVTSVTLLEPLPDQLSAAGLSAAAPIFHRLYHDALNWSAVSAYLLMILFFLSFAIFYRRFEAQQEELEQVNAALEAYAEREKTWALEQERNRIARDLHDTVAHQSTGLIIQLQKLKYAYQRGEQGAVEASLHESEQAARTMLEDMRQSVRMIAPVEASGSPFEQLFDDFAQLADMTINHDGLAQFYELPFPEQADLYRLLQEALTNARRHGRADHVSILAEKQNGMLAIRITDNGSGAGGQWEKGFGLRQMEERVHASGGRLHVDLAERSELFIEWPLPSKGGER
ncbi:sensor histidine kinase [Alkalicoccus chagannorensis]|uniref:sensor histidine kinase n=1 Tax=Alkalicoccus chagannorensis TaxID=427072 RepID=UPI00042712BB|nr:histidine kinase [Alkalicoccus chagannorensis]